MNRFQNIITELEELCKNNSGKACLFAGHYHYLLKNSKKSNSFYKKSCDLGEANGCHNFGNSISKKKPYKAFSYYKKACTLQFTDSCLTLSNLYKIGYGVKKDYNKSVFFYKKAISIYKKNCDEGNGDECLCGRFYHRKW